MSSAWVCKNLVEKDLVKASVVDGTIELEVIGEGEVPDVPETPLEEASAYLQSIGDTDG